jgi:hypothetical protein
MIVIEIGIISLSFLGIENSKTIPIHTDSANSIIMQNLPSLLSGLTKKNSNFIFPRTIFKHLNFIKHSIFDPSCYF